MLVELSWLRFGCWENRRLLQILSGVLSPPICMLRASNPAILFLRNKAAALCLDSLLDRLAERRYQPLREVVVKMLALSVWRQRPDVKKVRAIFASVDLPSISEFDQGKAERSKPMFTFDFSVREKQEH